MSLFAFVWRVFCVRLTETLAHFLWQGMAIGLLVLPAAALLRRSSSPIRYVVYVVALLLMGASPVATFWGVGGPDSPESVESLETAASHGAPRHSRMSEAAKTLPSPDLTLVV